MAKISAEAAEAAIQPVAVLLNNGYIRVYSGAAPANVATAIAGGNTLLAELRFGATAFTVGGVDGIVTATAVTADASADATGVATFCRCLKSDGTTAVMDLDTATEVVFNTNNFVATAPVSITSFQLRQPLN